MVIVVFSDRFVGGEFIAATLFVNEKYNEINSL